MLLLTMVDSAHIAAGVFHLPTLASTVEWGRCLARSLSRYCTNGSTTLLSGELGAGKTTLCQALVQCWCGQQPVTSPTFPIVVEYDVDRAAFPEWKCDRVWHVDLYRIESEHDLLELGLFQRSKISYLIEWPERLPARYPLSSHGVPAIFLTISASVSDTCGTLAEARALALRAPSAVMDALIHDHRTYYVSEAMS